MSPSTSYNWSPIEDLPENWEALTSPELRNVLEIWEEQSKRLQNTNALKQFNEKLAREWSIETGIIENLYSIDRGTTHLLIEKGIETALIAHGTTDKPAEEIVAILRDQQETLEGIFDFVAQRRTLSTSYIKQLHASMTRNQPSVEARNGFGRVLEVPLIRGEWKNTPNNPTRPDGAIHEYCPPEHVGSEMDRLIELHLQHTGNDIPPEVEAAWLHHRFTQIHPFQDGNGRVARALASILFLRAQAFPLTVHRDRRDSYIMALEAADKGDLQQLTKLFAASQSTQFRRALSLSEEVLTEHAMVHDVIAAATERLRDRFKVQTELQRNVFKFADDLKQVTEQKFEDLRVTLTDKLRTISPDYVVLIDSSHRDTSHWFNKQIIETANIIDYFADTRTYHSWVRLKIREERQTEIVISLHSLGTEFSGVIAGSAFVEYRDRSEGGEPVVDGPYQIMDELFQCYYNENENQIVSRFEKWLETVVLLGLEHWRRQL